MPKRKYNSRHCQNGPKNPEEKTMNKIMNTQISLIVIAGVLTLAPMIAAQSSVQTEANAVSIKGKVSCTRFGRGSVSARKGMSVAQTIQYCANFQGGDYTLVSGNRIYRLTGDRNVLAKMSGQTVEVAGRMVPEKPDATTYALMGTVAVTEVVPTKE
jgi:hypothetical protein